MDYTSVIMRSNKYIKIVDELDGDKLCHAYLIKSADQDYLKQFCFCVAAKIVNSNLNSIQKNIHPDVFISEKLDADGVNSLAESLYISPYQSDKKVYVLLNAENINEVSQNKLLKSLEEPPKNVVFLLACNSTNKILSTVKSRTKLIELDNLSNDQILDILVSNGSDKNLAQIAVCNCGGNSTLAKKFTSDNFLNLYNICLDMLENVKSSRDCLLFVNLLDNKTIDKSELLDLVMILMRDCLVIISGNPNLVQNSHQLDRLKLISSSFTPLAASNIISICLKLKEDLFFNANGVQVIDKLVMHIAEEKFKCKK